MRLFADIYLIDLLYSVQIQQCVQQTVIRKVKGDFEDRMEENAPRRGYGHNLDTEADLKAVHRRFGMHVERCFRKL